MGLGRASRGGSRHREPARLQTRGDDLEGRQAQAGGAVIFEAVIITRNADGSLHIVPLGYREADEDRVIAPVLAVDDLTGTDWIRVSR